MPLPPVLVTNFKRRITGVTSTAINVTARQQCMAPFAIGLCGPRHGLRLWQVLLNGWQRPRGYECRVWHVRRNSEMAWGLFAKHILRQPIRLVFTSAAIRRHSAYPRWLISKMDKVIATSTAAAGLLEKVDLVQGHGVDTDRFRPGEKTAQPSLVCVGRIRAEKGVDIFIAALCQVLPQYPEVHMHFLGQARPEDQSFLRAQKNQLQDAGLGAQVTWHGEVTATQVAAHLSTCHILVATPRYEGFGLTAFEGMAAGCALLLSDTGAFAEATCRGETGYLVPIGDVAATARALSDLLSQPARTQQMQALAREVALTHYDLEHEAQGLVNLYEDLLDPRR